MICLKSSKTALPRSFINIEEISAPLKNFRLERGTVPYRKQFVRSTDQSFPIGNDWSVLRTNCSRQNSILDNYRP
jgi:hypothetical protein